MPYVHYALSCGSLHNVCRRSILPTPCSPSTFTGQISKQRHPVKGNRYSRIIVWGGCLPCRYLSWDLTISCVSWAFNLMCVYSGRLTCAASLARFSLNPSHLLSILGNPFASLTCMVNSPTSISCAKPIRIAFCVGVAILIACSNPVLRTLSHEYRARRTHRSRF